MKKKVYKNIQVEIVGRLCRKPEILEAKSGKEYSKVSVAVNGTEESATFFDVVCFGKKAEYMTKYDKGQVVLVRGRLDIKPYLSKKGEAKVNLTIIGKTILRLDLPIEKKVKTGNPKTSKK